MIEFEKPNIECLAANDEENYAKFVCEPLERGYGMTIGNSLRRILLSSLPGTAITSVKIDGVVHEFSCIPGVVEDVPEIIVNLKSVMRIIQDKGEKLEAFIKIYEATMKNNGADSYYYFEKEYFQELIDKMHDHIQFFYAEYQGIPVSASIFLYNENFMHYHFWTVSVKC